MLLTVVSRNGKEVVKGGIEILGNETVRDLKSAIYARTGKLYPERQRLTLPLEPGQTHPTVLDGNTRLGEIFSVESHYEVILKDLGPQVKYSTLFFFEYLGPLLIYPLFYYFPVYNYFGLPEEQNVHPVQTYALIYWCFHYFKRIIETYFVHRFSHATSPLSNVFRNCLYYWSFAALIAYSINHPHYKPVGQIQICIGFGIGILCQFANLYCHIILKNLRATDGKGGYQVPKGFLFNYVTCANYTTEIYQWLGFNIATQTLAGYLFLAAATFIMTKWAIGKHQRLKKLFDGKEGRVKYPRRWVILPPFL